MTPSKRTVGLVLKEASVQALDGLCFAIYVGTCIIFYLKSSYLFILPCIGYGLRGLIILGDMRRSFRKNKRIAVDIGTIPPAILMRILFLGYVAMALVCLLIAIFGDRNGYRS
jgi:hypothetical protein